MTNRPRTLALRAVALATSLSLAGCLVWRAQTGAELRRVESTPQHPAPSPGQASPQEFSPDRWRIATDQDGFILGSKSAVIVLEGADPETSSASNKDQPGQTKGPADPTFWVTSKSLSNDAFFSSSKSAGPPSAGFFFDDGLDGAFSGPAHADESNVDPDAPRVFRPNPVPTWPAESPFLPSSKSALLPAFTPARLPVEDEKRPEEVESTESRGGSES